METFLILALIVLLAQTVETVSGFGSTVIAVTLGVHILPLSILVPTLVMLNLVLSSYLVSRYFYKIDTRLLTRRILPWMLLGLAIGVWVFSAVDGPTLRYVLGFLVVVFSAVEFVKLYRAEAHSLSIPLPDWLAKLTLIGAGLIHGIYASGGPLLVYYASRLQWRKGIFRSTLSAVWLTLNITLVISYLLTGKITTEVVSMWLVLLPMVPAGIILGEKLHNWINEKNFRLAVYGLLMMAGATLLIP